MKRNLIPQDIQIRCRVPIPLIIHLCFSLEASASLLQINSRLKNENRQYNHNIIISSNFHTMVLSPRYRTPHLGNPDFGLQGSPKIAARMKLELIFPTRLIACEILEFLPPKNINSNSVSTT
jgi:hypothetical protein